MAVNILKSTILTNRDATPVVLNRSATAQKSPFTQREGVLTVTADSIASQYGFFSIPSNAILSSCTLCCDALSTSVAADIGLWETPAVGGFSATTGWLTQAGAGLSGVIANAKQFFGAAVTLAAAQTNTQLYYSNTAFITLLTSRKRVWEQLGLAVDPQRFFDVVVTLTVAVVAGGSIQLECVYKLGG